MRRLMVLVVVLLMTAMVVATAMPAVAAAVRPPIAGIMGGGGSPVNPAACELLADGSGEFAWRPGGVCWFTPPVSASDFL
jgi:hypothetical protein